MTTLISQGSEISPEESQGWAQKVPVLLRKEVSEMPNSIPSSTNPNKTTSIVLRIAGIGVGAVLTIATFTKVVPKNWKCVTGGVAIGATAMGLYMGNKVNSLMTCSLSETRKAFLKYADGLERDPALMQKLANHLASSPIQKEMLLEYGSVESVVVKKAIEFGQTTPYLNPEKLADNCIAPQR